MRSKVVMILLLILFMQCSTTINVIKNSEGVQIDNRTDIGLESEADIDADIDTDEEDTDGVKDKLDSIDK